MEDLEPNSDSFSLQAEASTVEIEDYRELGILYAGVSIGAGASALLLLPGAILRDYQLFMIASALIWLITVFVIIIVYNCRQKVKALQEEL